MRVALDSNIIIYAEGLTDDSRTSRALDLLAAIPAESLVIPLQAAAETLQWLIRKGGMPRAEAAHSIEQWTSHYSVQPTDQAVMSAALELVTAHHLQVFDAIMLAAAAKAGATLLLSEDMHGGFKWRGVTVVNPFADEPSPLIQKILSAKP